MVFQHFSLFETLTVVENVALALPATPDLEALSRADRRVSEKYGLPVDPRRLVHALSVGERQRVEIIRCLLQKPKLLIMDEPTSVLTPQAVRKLFETLRQLAAEGCSILYISHKLDEIQELCHTATVLRGGQGHRHLRPGAGDAEVDGADDDRRGSARAAHGGAAERGEARAAIGAACRMPADDPFGTDLKDIHLTVYAGEIVGIAGVSGNGQQELLYALSGEQPLADRCPVQILGSRAGGCAPGGDASSGSDFVPEERLGRGAVPRMSLADNALLTGAPRGMLKHGLSISRRSSEFARECIEQVQREVRRSDGAGAIAVGRQPAEIHRGPRDPAAAEGDRRRAADVGRRCRRRRVHPAGADRSAHAGAAVLVVSEELDELFEICDRIAVIAQGPAVAAEAGRRHQCRGDRRAG